MTTIESLATNEIISAHDTIPGHSASIIFLISSINENPLSVRFGIPTFSVWLPELEVKFKSTDASHPFNHHTKKNKNYINNAISETINTTHI